MARAQPASRAADLADALSFVDDEYFTRIDPNATPTPPPPVLSDNGGLSIRSGTVNRPGPSCTAGSHDQVRGLCQAIPHANTRRRH